MITVIIHVLWLSITYLYSLLKISNSLITANNYSKTFTHKTQKLYANARFCLAFCAQYIRYESDALNKRCVTKQNLKTVATT